ncbi:MAG: dehalogenase [Anaerolineae bacterium]|nr:dehalogenase [Anaerolineae bacterium]
MLWLVLGLLIGAGVMYLARNAQIKLAWYDWLIAALAIILLLLGISNYFGSVSELEPGAAGFLLAAFGIPGLILAAVVILRVWRSARSAAA